MHLTWPLTEFLFDLLFFFSGLSYSYHPGLLECPLLFHGLWLALLCLRSPQSLPTHSGLCSNFILSARQSVSALFKISSFLHSPPPYPENEKLSSQLVLVWDPSLPRLWRCLVGVPSQPFYSYTWSFAVRHSPALSHFFTLTSFLFLPFFPFSLICIILSSAHLNIKNS